MMKGILRQVRCVTPGRWSIDDWRDQTLPRLRSRGRCSLGEPERVLYARRSVPDQAHAGALPRTPGLGSREQGLLRQDLHVSRDRRVGHAVARSAPRPSDSAPSARPGDQVGRLRLVVGHPRNRAAGLQLASLKVLIQSFPTYFLTGQPPLSADGARRIVTRRFQRATNRRFRMNI